MLSERQLEELLKVFHARTQKVSEEYLRRMGEHLRDIGKLSDTDVHRLIQLKRMNANIEAVKREIARIAAVMIGDVDEVFRQIAADDERFAREIFATDHTPPVKFSPTAELSSPVERILKAQLRVTQQEMANLSQTTIDSTLYREAVDVAVQTVQMGVADYTSAIRKAMKTAAADGLKVVYPSGYSRRLDTAVRQNVLDGIRALNQDVLEQLGKDFRADGVEISAHALCAEDHLPYQGRQYSNKDFERIQNSLYRRFGIWNCKHTWYPIVMGVTEPTYSEDELAQYALNSRAEITIDGRTMSRYEWSQQMRRIETHIRAQKDIAVAAKAEGDMTARREAQRNINRWQAEYSKISKAAGLDKRADRMSVSGFRRVKTADELKNRSERAKIKTEQNRAWLQRGYDTAVKNGDISALTSFEHYMNVAYRVEMTLVGSVTSDGIQINGYKTHFLDRIIGSYEKKREPVTIESAKYALGHGEIRKNRPASGKPSNVYSTSHCKVSINPETGTLIQATPKERGR